MWKIEGDEAFVDFQQENNELALKYMAELEAPLVMPGVDFSPEVEDFALTATFVSI